jgi:hypothetical protein
MIRPLVVQQEDVTPPAACGLLMFFRSYCSMKVKDWAGVVLHLSRRIGTLSEIICVSDRFISAVITDYPIRQRQGNYNRLYELLERARADSSETDWLGMRFTSISLSCEHE